MNCICDLHKCSGCGVCFKACKKNNISLYKKNNGFLFAKQNDPCNDCDFICPQLNNGSSKNANKAYAVQLTDDNDLLLSTSGGAFSAVCKYVFSKGGIVYGAVYDKKLQVIHKCAYSIQDIEPMRGSKYVYSDFYTNLDDVKNNLESGKMCFVVSIPCQIAALYSYLGKNYDNLLTADLVCNGVPSHKLWRAYLDDYEKRKSVRIIDFKFRDKRKYGLSHTTVIKYIKNNKLKEKTVKNRNEVSYYVAFGKQNCLNDTCYTCKYTGLSRVGDLTLGGFWGGEESNTRLNIKKGISLVLVNSAKGQTIVDRINEFCNMEEHPISIAILHNDGLKRPTSSIQQKEIFEMIDLRGYRFACKAYFPTKNRVYNCLVSSKVVSYLFKLLRNR